MMQTHIDERIILNRKAKTEKPALKNASAEDSFEIDRCEFSNMAGTTWYSVRVTRKQLSSGFIDHSKDNEIIFYESYVTIENRGWL